MKFITKSEIIDRIWNDNIGSFKKKDIEYIVNSFVEIIKEGIKKGIRVKIEGLGTFSSYVRKSYFGKSVDGNIEKIPDTKYIGFKPSKKLK